MSNRKRTLNLCTQEDLGRDISDESGKLDGQNKFVCKRPNNDKIEVNAPLLSLVSIPPLEMAEVSIQFDMEINETDNNFNQ